MPADLAKELVKNNPEFAVEDDDVLMAISKTFPNGLNFWETFIYPSKILISRRYVDNLICYSFLSFPFLRRMHD